MKVSILLVVAVLAAAVGAQEQDSMTHSAGLPSASSLASQSFFGQSAGSRSVSGGVPDPLSLGLSPPGSGVDSTMSNSLPPYNVLNSQSTTSPNIVLDSHHTLSLDLDRRIKQTDALLNRMVWQLNRETSWANSVHDIIQNYQYKYTKVLSQIKDHSTKTGDMRKLLSTLKKARLHEILEEDLQKAQRELTELASSSSETSADEGSYAALKDRVSLMKNDLEKMSHNKVNKVLHNVQEELKKAGDAAVPPASKDTLASLMK